MEQIKVPPGSSGQRPIYNSENINLETLANEVSLSKIGDFEPLDIKIDCASFMQEIAKYDGEWVDYLPRTDRVNNRQALVLYNLPGKLHNEDPSLAEAIVRAGGNKLSELLFNSPTDVYHSCHSLRPILSLFDSLGRSFLIKSNIGGYFVPHRDHPVMPRDVFRIVVFLNNCSPMDYDWIQGVDKKMSIEMGRAYYVNTMQTHRTISWVDDSIHLILNIPLTSDNVAVVMSHLLHRH
jgi:hypothetical protein